MSTYQRITLVVVALLVIARIVFPVKEYYFNKDRITKYGYELIIKKAKAARYTSEQDAGLSGAYYKADFTSTLLHLIGILIVGSIAYVLAGQLKREL